MSYLIYRRSLGLLFAVVALIGFLTQTTTFWSAAETTQDKQPPLATSPQKKAEALGIKFEKLEPGFI